MNAIRNMRVFLDRMTRKKGAAGMFWRGVRILVRYGPPRLVIQLVSKAGREIALKRFLKTLDLTEEEARAQREAAFPEEHVISILVPLYNTPKEFLEETIRSVREQTYGGWQLCLADGSTDRCAYVGEYCREQAAADARITYRKLERNAGISENTNACIDMAEGDYIALFDHDDLLHAGALYEVMRAICEEHADFIYSDEMVFESPDRNKVTATHFKPDYAPDNLLSNNYICHLSVFRKSLLEKAGRFRKECDGSQDHDIILRLTDCAEKVVHIPKVLYFWRSHAASTASDIGTKTYAVTAGQFAVKDFLLNRKGIDAEVESIEACPTMYHVKYPTDRESAVEIVLDLAGGKGGKGVSAEEAVQSVAAHTRYPRVTLAFITRDGETPLPETPFPARRVIHGSGSRAERYNAAAKDSRADYLVFLDPGLTVEKDNWLEEMLMFAGRETTGAVGARILFRNGTVRHGGLITGYGRKGTVGRSHFRIARENAGYFGMLSVAEDVSAVSAECMMISREKLLAAGGFDPRYTDTLFDADLCLRLKEKGLLNVYTPFAELCGGNWREFAMDYGVEKPAYGRDAAAFRERWEDALQKTDPYYNPNLATDYPDFRLGNGKK